MRKSQKWLKISEILGSMALFISVSYLIHDRKYQKQKGRRTNEYEKYLMQEHHTPFMQIELINPTYDADVFRTAVKHKDVSWLNVSNFII